jgi:hypothetical protein
VGCQAAALRARLLDGLLHQCDKPMRSRIMRCMPCSVPCTVRPPPPGALHHFVTTGMHTAGSRSCIRPRRPMQTPN